MWRCLLPSKEELKEKEQRAYLGITLNPRKGEYCKAEFTYGNCDMTPEECCDVASEALAYALKKVFEKYDHIDKIIEGGV